MYRIIVSTFIILASLTIHTAAAQSKEKRAVATAVERLRKAMIDADGPTLSALTAEKLSYGHSSGRVEDKTSFVNAIATGASDFVSISLTDQTIAVTGKTAIVRHTLEAATNDSGNPGNVKLTILLVWHKDKSAWKLLARQAVQL